jgi:hypothetical protein
MNFPADAKNSQPNGAKVNQDDLAPQFFAKPVR